MKEIFEKIVLDSVGTLKDEITNEIKSSYKKNKNDNFSGISNSYKQNLEKNESSHNGKNKQEFNNANNIGVINAYSRNKRLNIMVASAALGLVFCLLMLTSYKGDLPGEVVGIISTVSGIFGACLKDAYSFEFGSSRGSKDKDDKISTAILERFIK